MVDTGAVLVCVDTLGTGGKQVLRYARLFGWPGIFHTFVSDINDLPGEGIEEWGDNSAGISVNARAARFARSRADLLGATQPFLHRPLPPSA